jgi:hypothetical protein
MFGRYEDGELVGAHIAWNMNSDTVLLSWICHTLGEMFNTKEGNENVYCDDLAYVWICALFWTLDSVNE